MRNIFLRQKSKQTIKLYYATLKSLINAGILIEDNNISNTFKILTEEMKERQENHYYSLCPRFGQLDGMNGLCHYCRESNESLFDACWKEKFKDIESKEERE